MLFNSYEFIFVFAPLAVAGFFVLGRRSRTTALSWLIFASLGFYAWWRPFNVLIIAPSIVVNFLLARAILRLRNEGRDAASTRVLVVGIAFNVAFLGYFKYANFALDSLNDVFGTSWVMARIVLPLGISFITFQKIAFLIDVHARRIGAFGIRDYCLFVLFFPQLIAGPIVHYREMMPQFERVSGKPKAEDLAVGVTLFAFGLFKKVVLADGIAPFVSPLYSHAAGGGEVSFITGWLAAIGFTFQIYFDFSGYSDMALGLARLFGIRFPPNFYSPLKASNIIDFWTRWHMTLTRFLTAYIYNPLAVRAARRRAQQGKSLVGARSAAPGAFAEGLMVPVLITMFVSGWWHGAGYNFILWGLLHGVYITINHAWRRFGPRQWRASAGYQRIMKPGGWLLTFTAVTVAMVLFRAPTMKAAANIVKGMFLGNGVALPASIYDSNYQLLVSWTLALGVIALTMPNTLQMLARYEPALGIKAADSAPVLERKLAWSPSLVWVAAVSALIAIGMLRIGGHSEFLYWQF